MRNICCLVMIIILALSCKTDQERSENGKDGSLKLDAIQINTDTSLKNDKEWYKDAIFYHIWVRAFNDSNNDNYGDINGIIKKLDYLNDGNPETKNDLGIDAIWLSPIFECAGKGSTIHAYDTTDYLRINDKFGNEEDLKNLLRECHKRGIKVIFDFVPNHVSINHPWFIDSVNNGSKKDWFIWNKNPDKDFEIPWGGGKYTDVWHKVIKNKSYFYGAFARSMPDINFNNIEAKSSVTNVLIHWLNEGFDGVRIDAARYIYEDGPKKQADCKRTFEYFSMLRKDILDKYEASTYSKMMVGEVWTSSEIIKKYYGTGNDMFHMCFDFPLTQIIRNAVYAGDKSTAKIKELNNYIIDQMTTYPDGYRNATFLNNHDNVTSRPMSDYEGNEAKAILAFALNILLPGTPFVYYGNELGMLNGKGSGDLRFRTNMEWEKYENNNKNNDSILSWYRYLINLRNNSESIKRGDYKEIKTTDSKILAFARSFKDETNIVVINFKKDVSDVQLDFTNSGVKNGDLSIIIGNLYNGHKNITDDNYNKFLVEKMPPFSVRVFSKSAATLIAKDYLNNK